MQSVEVSKVEASDYDFVIQWVANGIVNYLPVQLKELPPSDLNADVSLQDILNGLTKYSGLADLAVLIHLNRQFRFEYYPEAHDADARIRELWFLACAAEDQSHWFLYGDVVGKQARRYDFQYPTRDESAA